MQNHPPVATDPPTTDSDRHLLARVRLRDSAAFEQLFGRYYAPLRQALGRMLGDDDQADDLTQETFLALYTHPPQLQHDEEALRCWLYRVALNRGYNTLRTRRRDAARLPDLYRPDAALDPEAEAVRREERERVQLALATLPERQAKLLVLRQQEGLKYAELAAILEVAPSSIGTLLVRAERAFQLAWNQLSTARPTPNTKGEHQP